jgi:hypothetical protein
MQKYQLRLLYQYGVNILITLIIVLVAMVLVKRQMPPSIVKIDLVAITTHYSELMLKQSADNNDAAIKKISETVKTNLEPMLAAYATSNHVVILQAQALVDTTTPDITNDIIDELDQKIK